MSRLAQRIILAILTATVSILDVVQMTPPVFNSRCS